MSEGGHPEMFPAVAKAMARFWSRLAEQKSRELTDRAKKVATCIYIAADEEVARDVAEVIRLLLAENEQLHVEIRQARVDFVEMTKQRDYAQESADCAKRDVKELRSELKRHEFCDNSRMPE